jgi:dTDP-4-amino-4,6-dideoxygalactose transaminase/predicted amidohydrolase
MSNTVRYALLQASHAVPMSAPIETIRQAAVARYTELLREAAAGGARLAVLPELFALPYFCRTTDPRWYAAAEPLPDGPTTTHLRCLARELGLVIIAPVYERTQLRRFNTAAVIDADGDLLGVYRKHHIPSCHQDNYEPFFFHQPDLGFPVFDTAAGRIGISICYDRHFPEVARAYGLAGAQVLINVSATSGAMSEQVWELEQQAHALANGYFVAAVNRSGVGEPYDSAAFFGRSYVCGPDGQIIARAGAATTEALLVDLDLERTSAIRENWHTGRLFADLRPGTYTAAQPHKETRMTIATRQLQYKPIMTDEMKAAAVAALEDGRMIRSRFEKDSEGGRFEADVTAYLNVQHGVAVSSGWAAMHVAFLAAGIGPGDEVITVPNTFISVGDVIELVGARPVFVDIDAATFNIDPDRIEAAITPRTRAIMPVHTNGLTCDMGPIRDVARRHNLLLLVDSCQTLGSAYRGSRRDTLGDIAALSFVRNKSMTCGGEGGMVVTDDPDLAYRCQLFANHGRGSDFGEAQNSQVVGLNYRLSEILAAIGRVQLPQLDDWNHQRRANAAVYEELFAGRDLPVQLPPEPEWGYHTRMRYVIRVQKRDALQAYLTEHGIAAHVEYPTPIHLNRPYIQRYGYKRGDFPLSEQCADEVLTLPIWPGLTRDDLAYVVETVEAFYKG